MKTNLYEFIEELVRYTNDKYNTSLTITHSDNNIFGSAVFIEYPDFLINGVGELGKGFTPSDTEEAIYEWLNGFLRKTNRI